MSVLSRQMRSVSHCCKPFSKSFLKREVKKSSHLVQWGVELHAVEDGCKSNCSSTVLYFKGSEGWNLYGILAKLPTFRNVLGTNPPLQARLRKQSYISFAGEVPSFYSFVWDKCSRGLSVLIILCLALAEIVRIQLIMNVLHSSCKKA